MEELKKNSTIITFIGQIVFCAAFYFNMKSDVSQMRQEVDALKVLSLESRVDRGVIHEKIDLQNKEVLIEITKIQKDIQFIKEQFNPQKNE